MRNDYEKSLTQTQMDIQSVEQGWLFYLPDAPPPSLPAVCNWVRTATLSRILDLIEICANDPSIINKAGRVDAVLRREHQARKKGSCVQ